MVPRSRCSILKTLTLVAENCSGSSLEEQFGVLQNYDDLYNTFDIVTAPFQHLNYEVTLHFNDHLQAVTTFVCCFPRAWIAAFVSRQKINSGLALREFGLFPQGTTFFSPML